MSALELHSLYKAFGRVPAVSDVSLSIKAGSRTAIVGPSGSGKTTLLRMIAGFEFPDSGSITLHGRPLADDTTEVPAHRRLIGYVPQDGALFPHLTVAANIGFGLTGSAAARQPRVDELMRMVELDPQMGRRWPHELSGGQQQRVALARALAQRPQLMLLDEPFSALDTGLRAAMRKTVARLLAEAQVTTILVTHDQAEALSFADQLAVMRQGRLVQAGRPMDVYRHPKDEETALFLGDAILLVAQIEHGWATCALGRVRVGDHASHGSARIMLRPEQLQIAGPDLHPERVNGCVGVVAESDFGGNTCILTVDLMNPSHAIPDRPLLVRVPGIDAPSIGSTVHITTVGHAHVIGAPVNGRQVTFL